MVSADLNFVMRAVGFTFGMVMVAILASLDGFGGEGGTVAEGLMESKVRVGNQLNWSGGPFQATTGFFEHQL